MVRQTKLWLLVVMALVGPAAAFLPQLAQADTAPAPDWVQRPVQGPSGRESVYLAYDGGRNRTVLFGGVNQGSTANTYLSDTWEYDGTTWAQIPVTGPPAGALGQMVYDSARGVSVLFGGGDNNGFLAPITWEWNGTTWNPRFTTHRPPSRIWFGMTYDSARHMTVLFGGDGADAGGNHLLLNDTWEYDGSDWRQVATARSPSGRYGLGLAYDSGRGKTVMFGGHDDTTGRLNDTWEYDGNDWTQVVIANPPAVRFLHSMAYVSALGKTVVFGGDYFVPGVTLGPNNETWLYDGASWQQLITANSPSPRSMASVAYDSAHTSLILFGGSTQLTPFPNFSDTWALVVPESQATFSVSSVQFPQEPVLSVTTQNVTLTNSGNAPLAISSIAAGGDFATTDNCPRPPSTVAVNASCTITVSFSPSQGNTPISGTLTVTDNTLGGAQSIPLSGSGQWGEVNPLAAAIDFGTSQLNQSGPTASAVETVDFPDFATIVTRVASDPPFLVTTFDCPTGVVLAVGTTCHAQLAFQPGMAGSYSGQLRISANTPNAATVNLSGTATPIPVAIALQVGQGATFGQSLGVQANTSAASGTATFTFNGVQVGSPVDLNTGGAAFHAIPLNDSTIPAGAGTYSLLVTVHPTDGVHSDGSFSQLVTVVPATIQTSWAGSALMVTGSAVTLSAAVSATPAGHQVWVRFDVTNATGTTSTYYALVDATGSASVNVNGLRPGTFTVLARLVAASGSATPNAYVAANDLRAAFAVAPARGGFVAGATSQGTTTVGFEFAPGSTPTGSLAWVQVVQVTAADGRQHQAYEVVTSTAVTSLTSHSKTVTVTGQAAVIFVDVATGAPYSSLGQTTPFQVSIAADGSAIVTIKGGNVGLPAGSAVNHL